MLWCREWLPVAAAADVAVDVVAAAAVGLEAGATAVEEALIEAAEFEAAFVFDAALVIRYDIRLGTANMRAIGKQAGTQCQCAYQAKKGHEVKAKMA